MLIWNRHKEKTGKQPKKRRNTFRRILAVTLVVSMLFGAVVTVKPKLVGAGIRWIVCSVCKPRDLAAVGVLLEANRVLWEGIIKEDIRCLMNWEENWIVEEFYKDFWFKAVAELTEYLSAHGLYQVEMVGSFFDARNHIETSRLIFRLQAEAHKDYYPSEDFCWFGTNARSMAASESMARTNMLALSKHGIDRQLGKKGVASSYGKGGDKTGRWHQFVDTYCDPKDNGWTVYGTGMDLACDHDGIGSGAETGASNRSRINIDIDYTRLIETPRTLDIDFSNGIETLTDDEEDILSMSSNLYGNQVPSRTITLEMMKKHPAAQKLYLDQRTVIARRTISQNSFNAIVAMKSAGSSSSFDGPATASYMAAIMKELMPSGTTEADIFEIIGENPSYYAQLEILSKKLYESPKFFAKLYDTPANVDRKSVAMKAVELMLDRALFESELRQEMLLSVMLSTELDRNFRKINKNMSTRRNY